MPSATLARLSQRSLSGTPAPFVFPALPVRLRGAPPRPTRRGRSVGYCHVVVCDSQSVIVVTAPAGMFGDPVPATYAQQGVATSPLGMQ